MEESENIRWQHQQIESSNSGIQQFAETSNHSEIAKAGLVPVNDTVPKSEKNLVEVSSTASESTDSKMLRDGKFTSRSERNTTFLDDADLHGQIKTESHSRYHLVHDSLKDQSIASAEERSDGRDESTSGIALTVQGSRMPTPHAGAEGNGGADESHNAGCANSITSWRGSGEGSFPLHGGRPQPSGGGRRGELGGRHHTGGRSGVGGIGGAAAAMLTQNQPGWNATVEDGRPTEVRNRSPYLHACAHRVCARTRTDVRTHMHTRTRT